MFVSYNPVFDVILSGIVHAVFAVLVDTFAERLLQNGCRLHLNDRMMHLIKPKNKVYSSNKEQEQQHVQVQ